MATMIPPQKNVEYIFFIGLTSQADTKLLQNNPTLASGDVLVSTDGGSTSNLDTIPAVTPASSDMVKVTVSATEMNGDNTIIVFSDAAGSEWCDKLINIQTAAQTLDAMDTNIDDIETDTNELQGLIASSKIAAQVKSIDDIDFSATMKTSLETAVDDGLDNAISNPTAHSAAQRIEALDLLAEASGAGDLAAILTDTAQIGAAGAGLSDLGGMSTTMKGQVESECKDAIEADGLDHLVSASVVGADITDNSIIAKMVSKDATADWDDFVNTTDALQAIRDKETDIETDTNELQTDLANGGRLDLLIDAILADTAALNDTAMSELSQGIPSATPTLKAAIMLIYMALRNKLTVTSAELGIYNNAGTKITKKVLADDGTTYTETEAVSGA